MNTPDPPAPKVIEPCPIVYKLNDEAATCKSWKGHTGPHDWKFPTKPPADYDWYE